VSVASNEQAQALLRVHEEMAAQQERDDLVAVMSTPGGRRFVWGLIDGALVTPSFAGEASHATAFNEGRRAVALGLFFRVQRETPDLYLTALNEQLAAQRTAATLREAAMAEAANHEEETLSDA
jgi:hypothetical protein